MTTTHASGLPCFKKSLSYHTEVRITWSAIVNKWMLHVRIGTPALCSECSEFRYRFLHWLLLTENCRRFLNLSSPIPLEYLKLNHAASSHILPKYLLIQTFDIIQSVPGGKANILEGHSIGHSKQKSVYVPMSYYEKFLRWSSFTVQFRNCW
jgi:hypothetical protein